MDGALLKCKVCFNDKPADDFYASERKGEYKRCKACLRTARQKRINDGHEAYLKLLFGQLRSKRKSHGMEWEIEYEDVLALWDKQNGKCALSNLNMTHHRVGGGQKLPFNASIDRINHNEGYLKSNVQLVCSQVNTMRHTLNLDEFWWWVKTISEHQSG